mmetsp:Transcript_11721/g.32959  ORF Transcript_11721/g.32959 Transcript_11721/m.32959 type:complete len:270 (-) Transcript_11721:273-1082(-)
MTLMSKELGRYLSLNCFTVTGKVAENIRICRSAGMKRIISSIRIWNSADRSLSASSMMSMLHLDRLQTFFLVRSSTRPGVATTTWTGSYSRTMSSLSIVPPVETITDRPQCFPNSLHTCDVCSASSRVGTRMSTWISFLVGSALFSAGITNAAVFPVPFFALARMSLPDSAIGMAFSWMGDGHSKPFSKIPMSNSRFRYRSSKSFTSVDCTSSVFTRVSAGGTFRYSFHSDVPASSAFFTCASSVSADRTGAAPVCSCCCFARANCRVW